MKYEKRYTMRERFTPCNCRYLMKGLRTTHAEGTYPFFCWINLELELLNSGPAKMTASMINTIHLSGGLVTVYLIYLNVEEVVTNLIYIIIWYVSGGMFGPCPLFLSHKSEILLPVSFYCTTF